MRLAAKRLEARLHLPDLLSLTADPSDPSSVESVTAINVALTDPGDADAFAHDASAAIPIPQLTARAAQGGEGTAAVFVVLDRFHFAIAVVTVIASTMFLLALMVMLVEERRETVGILRLIGLRKRRILLQVFAEGLLIAVAGAVFGILFAAALQGAVNALLSVEVRHDADLRPHYSADRDSMCASGGTAGRAGESDLVVDTASQQRSGPRQKMSPFAFALRGLVRQPGRAILGIAGIAATGALLFDMLMLSQGLVVSMERLLAGVGFDIRVTATQATPLTGPPITNMANTVATLAALPGIEEVVPLRIGEAQVDLGDRRRQITFMGANAAGRRPWTLLQGQDLTIDAGRSTLDDRRSTIADQPQPRATPPARTWRPTHPPRGLHGQLQRASDRVSGGRHRGISVRSGTPADRRNQPSGFRASVRRRGPRRSRHADDRVAIGN